MAYELSSKGRNTILTTKLPARKKVVDRLQPSCHDWIVQLKIMISMYTSQNVRSNATEFKKLKDKIENKSPNLSINPYTAWLNGVSNHTRTNFSPS